MILSLENIRSDYRAYLLELHPGWDKTGTKHGSSGTRVSDTMFLWNNGNKLDFWEYLAGWKELDEAHALIRGKLPANATEKRKNDYCLFFDDFKEYIESKWGGIKTVIDEKHIEVFGKGQMVSASYVEKKLPLRIKMGNHIWNLIISFGFQTVV